MVVAEIVLAVTSPSPSPPPPFPPLPPVVPQETRASATNTTVPMRIPRRTFIRSMCPPSPEPSFINWQNSTIHTAYLAIGKIRPWLTGLGQGETGRAGDAQGDLVPCRETESRGTGWSLPGRRA